MSKRIRISVDTFEALCRLDRGYGIEAVLRDLCHMPVEDKSKRSRPAKQKTPRKPIKMSRAYPALNQLLPGGEVILAWKMDPKTGRPVEGQSGPRRAVQRVGHRTGWKLIMQGEPRGLVVTRIS